MKTILMAGTVLLGVYAAPAMAQQQVQLCNGVCLLTGGEAGDYYQYFGDPILALLRKAWVDTYKAKSPGAPASLAWVKTHPTSFAIVQGDVLARTLKQPDEAKSFKVVRAEGIGNEVLVAIMNDATYKISDGNFGAVAMHAKQKRFATGAKDSGSGATMLSLQQLDPDHLGQANVTFYRTIDTAIDAVASGLQDVVLMVQFANPDNDRFKKIRAAHLHFAPVMMGAMRQLTYPDGKPAYTICENVDTGAEKIDTACTPIALVTGATNDNPDLDRVFSQASDSDFLPKQSGFARFWKSMKTKGQAAASATLDAADRAAKSISDKM